MPFLDSSHRVRKARNEQRSRYARCACTATERRCRARRVCTDHRTKQRCFRCVSRESSPSRASRRSRDLTRAQLRHTLKLSAPSRKSTASANALACAKASRLDA
eukprot:6189410-Pleurochrysis_carterae.AAC.1